MKPYILRHNQRTEIRKKPLNFVDKDLNLFQKAFIFEIEQSDSLHLKNIDILKDTIFSTREFKFQTAYTHILPVKKSHLIKRLFKFFLPYNTINKAIWIIDEWSAEYFHWLTDSLSRLNSVRLFESDYTLILPKSYQDKPYISESLSILNFNVYYYNPKKRLRVKELLLPGHVAPTGNYNTEVINNIRTSFLKEKLIIPTKKIYISRQKAAKRKILNEDKVTALMIQYGYEIHFFEDYSFQEQINLMSEAISLVSLHGAGLTNMLFMQQGGQILEIRNQNDSHNNCFFSLASSLKHNYYYLCSEGTSKDTHAVDVNVDIDQLNAVIQLMK